MEELTASLAERSTSDPTQLPSNIRGIVAARLDALPRVGKDLLRRASVLGKRFWCEALTDLGQPGPWSVLPLLRRAEIRDEVAARLTELLRG